MRCAWLLTSAARAASRDLCCHHEVFATPVPSQVSKGVYCSEDNRNTTAHQFASKRGPGTTYFLHPLLHLLGCDIPSGLGGNLMQHHTSHLTYCTKKKIPALCPWSSFRVGVVFLTGAVLPASKYPALPMGEAVRIIYDITPHLRFGGTAVSYVLELGILRVGSISSWCCTDTINCGCSSQCPALFSR